MTLSDPGYGLPREEARVARIAAWPRPASLEERAEARESRKRSWLGTIAEGRKSAAAGQFLVSPNGRANGDGSVDRPWGLATALISDSVRPGDTVWLAAGRYEGVFRSTLLGEPQNEVTVRALPGERVVIDGGVRVESGGHVVFRGLELVNSRFKRKSELPGSSPADIDPNDGFFVTAPYVKLVNNAVHDTPQGIGIWGTSVGSEVYGNIVYNNGWTGPDRTHGHGIYIQNSDPAQPKRVEHNVFANTISHCLNPAEAFGGTYQEGPIRLAMTGWTCAQPLNDEQSVGASTLPRFGAFLLTTERGSAEEYASDLIPRPRDHD